MEKSVLGNLPGHLDVEVRENLKVATIWLTNARISNINLVFLRNIQYKSNFGLSTEKLSYYSNRANKGIGIENISKQLIQKDEFVCILTHILKY